MEELVVVVEQSLPLPLCSNDIILTGRVGWNFAKLSRNLELVRVGGGEAVRKMMNEMKI